MKLNNSRNKFTQLTNKSLTFNFKKYQNKKPHFDVYFHLSNCHYQSTSDQFRKSSRSFLDRNHNLYQKNSQSFAVSKINRENELTLIQHESLRNRLNDKIHQLQVEKQLINPATKIKFEQLLSQKKICSQLNGHLLEMKNKISEEGNVLKLELHGIKNHLELNLDEQKKQNIIQKIKVIEMKIKSNSINLERAKEENEEKTIICNKLLEKLQKLEKENLILKQQQNQVLYKLTKFEKANLNLRHQKMRMQEKYYQEIKSNRLEVRKNQQILDNLNKRLSFLSDQVNRKIESLIYLKKRYTRQLLNQEENYFAEIQQNVKLNYLLMDLKFVQAKFIEGQMKWKQIKHNLINLYSFENEEEQEERAYNQEVSEENNYNFSFQAEEAELKNKEQEHFYRENYLEKISIKQWSIKQQDNYELLQGIEYAIIQKQDEERKLKFMKQNLQNKSQYKNKNIIIINNDENQYNQQ